MKIAITSDLHGELPEIDKCDILCICGDICPTHNHNISFQENWLIKQFIPWCNSLNVLQVIFIAGNHDLFLEKKGDDYIKQVFFNQDKITYLKDECTALLPDECDRNVIIYGTPYCKQFGNWSFMREEKSLKKIYSMIPNDIDILLTHDAPDLNELGTIHEFNWNYNQTKINAGNKILAKEILKKKPKYAFCGHIHSGNHTLTDLNGIKVANVSRMNEKYEPVNEVLYIEI